jgi:type IV pilus assembly protein PilV
MAVFNGVVMKINKGIGLIEILVSLFVVSMTIIGVMALQGNSLKNNQGAWLRSYANIMSNDIFERMIANRQYAMAGAYDHALGSSIPSASGSMANIDLNQWLTGLANGLPEGDGSVACDSDGLCSVQVQWKDMSVNEDSNDDGEVSDDDRMLVISLVSSI